MDALFAAADITTLLSNVSTALIAFVGVALLFVGYRYLMRAFRHHIYFSGLPSQEEVNASWLEYKREKRRERAYWKYQNDSDIPGVAELGFYRRYD